MAKRQLGGMHAEAGIPLFLCAALAAHPREWAPIGRAMWRVETDRGAFVMAAVHRDPQELAWIDRVRHDLAARGWTHYLPWLPSPQGDAVWRSREGMFVVMRLPTAHAPPADALDRLFASLAALHRLTSTPLPHVRPWVDQVIEQLRWQWNRWKARLAQWQEEAGRRAYPSPVDAVFLANAEALAEALDRALALLARWEKAVGRRAVLRVSWVLARPRPDRLVWREGGEPLWLDWSDATVDAPVRDVAYLLRAVSRAVEEDRLPAALAAYDAHFPLREEERLALALLLAPPHAVFRLLERHYAWERRVRLEAVTALERELDRHALFGRLLDAWL
ncbi:hypothetical protein [Calditerricola satsumensis]|uniref:hypothetical protein n=1 Tax=Calditerricola satsumensis TaxID=373054 RepID=UPI001E4AD601|nr:hypothetical protein [Calditerricola satsumensis]